MWMRGDRFGEVVKVTVRKGDDHSVIDQPDREIAHVRMDRSGKVVRVWLEDCKVL
jgi:predicted secreted protein